MIQRNRSNEHEEQAAVVQWARFRAGAWPELAWLFAIPNGAYLGRTTEVRQGRVVQVCRQAAKLKAEGLLPGVADLFLPAARGRFHGLFIEMKHGDNTLTDEQQAFLEAMLGQGYLAMACWGAGQAIEEIERYLQLAGGANHA